MSYKIKELDSDSLEATKIEWETIAGIDEFATEYEPTFEWAANHMTQQYGDSRAFGLFQEGCPGAHGILEVIQRPHGQHMTKLLKMWVTPEFWDSPNKRDELSKLTFASIMGILELSRKSNSKKIRIFGRTDHFLSILHTLHIELSEMIDKEKLSGISVNIVKRWLEITLK